MPVALVLLLLCAPGAEAQTSSDDLTRRVAVYKLTMPRIEGYGAVMSGIAACGRARTPGRRGHG